MRISRGKNGIETGSPPIRSNHLEESRIILQHTAHSGHGLLRSYVLEGNKSTKRERALDLPVVGSGPPHHSPILLNIEHRHSSSPSLRASQVRSPAEYMFTCVSLSDGMARTGEVLGRGTS